MAQGRIVSGYRPTGRLHLGHLHGNLARMIELQNEVECFFFVADWHALTTDYQDPSMLRTYTDEMVLDWLAAGLDPEKAVIYLQSDLREVAEFQLYLSMITPLGWLERVPSFKEQLEQLQGRELSTQGFLGYPVLQTADIAIVLGERVPVGEDQLPHLELAREIVRRFNYLYGETLKEPEAVLSKYPRIPGTDGRKMSKSYNNYISLSDSPDEIRKKIMLMITDPARRTRKDAGDPEKSSVYQLHKIYSGDRLEEIAENCRTAGWGCVDCKKLLSERVIEALEPFRERRQNLETQPRLARDILAGGHAKVEPIAAGVLEEVRIKMSID
ncbi:MAG: tryptophan--tRNA ligase [Candidatus Solincola sediminis]|uniref:Tryptophan--tRNA ligase n=1 Tax=Candidatus Solincola sediminis TaxID=1797199 RepID=A0A1F2WTC9_9ACTN|nr:MAG: tryptophan--tRNA ligase [Candidatus Solincola sediminis]OFW60845.1 MAG: tryptophan--tRNA ligase [Candidatus Solincola sediminis]